MSVYDEATLLEKYYLLGTQNTLNLGTKIKVVWLDMEILESCHRKLGLQKQLGLCYSMGKGGQIPALSSQNLLTLYSKWFSHKSTKQTERTRNKKGLWRLAALYLYKRGRYLKYSVAKWNFCPPSFDLLYYSRRHNEQTWLKLKWCCYVIKIQCCQWRQFLHQLSIAETGGINERKKAKMSEY